MPESPEYAIMPEILSMIGAGKPSVVPPSPVAPRAVVTPAGPTVYVPPHLVQVPDEDKTHLMLHLQTKYGAGPDLAHRWATNIIASGGQSPDWPLLAEARKAHAQRSVAAVEDAMAQQVRARLPEQPPQQTKSGGSPAWQSAKLGARSQLENAEQERLLGVLAGNADPNTQLWAKGQIEQRKPSPAPEVPDQDDEPRGMVATVGHTFGLAADAIKDAL